MVRVNNIVDTVTFVYLLISNGCNFLYKNRSTCDIYNTCVSYSGFNLLKNKECEVFGCVVT